ncbi:hypothetical protein G6F57_012734 [Rhizopus arrhizus]|nr:hypothetical protein G6F33_012103 [Rhizopus arrhizus]KAG1415678.1 hypothetical protein G6F58_006369 [Rhizopus delemar]KAG0929211.1 hypothetical protein G6F30_012094 [Rhizopus arrhizus]KAG0974355.1 hypothetical protein G6F29_012256 [Rhizopus arrhizus]KAG0978519.1 hypothetical protein G6F28_012116 [Rhizopus arrhizus]
METTNNSQLVIVCHISRLPNPVGFTTEIVETQNHALVIRRPTSSGCGSENLFTVRNHRSISNSEQTVSFKLLYDTRKDKTPTNLGLPDLEQIRTVPSLQDGRFTSIERSHRTKGLYVQNRSQRCLRGSTDTSEFSSLPVVYESRNCVPISFTSLWPERSTSCLFQIDEICYGALAETGNQTGVLPGRYLYSSKYEDRSGKELQIGNESFGIIGIHHKLPKECFKAFLYTGIPRIHIQHRRHEYQSPMREDAET